MPPADWQFVLTLLCVLAAGGYLVRRVARLVTGGAAGGCGGGGCGDCPTKRDAPGGGEPVTLELATSYHGDADEAVPRRNG